MIPFGRMTYYSSVWFPGIFSSENNPLAGDNSSTDVSQATLIPIQSPNTVEKGHPKAHDNLVSEEPSGAGEDPEVVLNETPKSPEAIEEVVVAQPKEVPAARLSSSNFAYFIIAGAFNNESNALNLVKQLRSEGFEAIVADTNKYGMFRVAYKGFHSAEEAANELNRIKVQHNPQAWILKK